MLHYRGFSFVSALLDEYLPEYMTELLESLENIFRESPKPRLFFTGRPHVGEDVQKYFFKAVVIPISHNTDMTQGIDRVIPTCQLYHQICPETVVQVF